MNKEIKDKIGSNNFIVLHRKSLPPSTLIISTIQQIKRKRDIQSGKINKHKARLTVDGSKMKKGVHFEETYSPIANWSSVWLLLTLVVTLNWNSMQIDYIQAFSQVPMEQLIYFKIPADLE